MSNNPISATPTAASDAAIAQPTPPQPTTNTRAPTSFTDLRSTPRTKPAPSNMSPKSDPSERSKIALQAPAICAVGESSSTNLQLVTLCGMVISAPRMLVNVKMARSAAGKSSALTPIGITTASTPMLSKYGL